MGCMQSYDHRSMHSVMPSQSSPRRRQSTAPMPKSFVINNNQKKIVPEKINATKPLVTKSLPNVSKSIAVSSKEEDVPFPKVGVHISVFKSILNELIATHGEEAARRLRTEEVSERLIKPLTEPTKQSYCQLLQSQNSELVGTASLFISHAWRFAYADVIDAIENYLAEARKASRSSKNVAHSYLWFDLFSNNQNITKKLEFSWWCTTFKSAIEQFGLTVMVLAPWRNPVPLTRAWCIWEIYCTVITKAKFDVAMCEKERLSFLEIIRTADEESINSLLANIDTQKSESWNPEDWRQIQSIVARDVGFEAINHLVLERMRSWIMSCVLSQLKREKTKDVQSRLIMSRVALSLGQGRLSELEPVRFEVPSKSQANGVISGLTNLLGLSSDAPAPLTSVDAVAAAASKDKPRSNAKNELSSVTSDAPTSSVSNCQTSEFNVPVGLIEPINPIAEFNRRQCRIDSETENVLKTALKMVRARKPPAPIEEIQQLSKHLSYFYFQRGDYVKAKDYLDSIIRECSSALGQTHPLVLSALNSLGTIYVATKQWISAEIAYTECLTKKFEQYLDQCQPSIVSTLCNLAYVHQKLQKWDLAEAGYRKALAMQTSLFGPDHASTHATRSWLGYVFLIRGEVHAAEEMFEQCLQKEFLDRKDFNTMAALNNLGKIFEIQGREGAAKDKYKECIECLKGVDIDQITLPIEQDQSRVQAPPTDSLCTLRLAFVPQPADNSIRNKDSAESKTSIFELAVNNAVVNFTRTGNAPEASSLVATSEDITSKLATRPMVENLGTENLEFSAFDKDNSSESECSTGSRNEAWAILDTNGSGTSSGDESEINASTGDTKISMKKRSKSRRKKKLTDVEADSAQTLAIPTSLATSTQVPQINDARESPNVSSKRRSIKKQNSRRLSRKSMKGASLRSQRSFGSETQDENRPDVDCLEVDFDDDGAESNDDVDSVDYDKLEFAAGPGEEMDAVQDEINERNEAI